MKLDVQNALRNPGEIYKVTMEGKLDSGCELELASVRLQMDYVYTGKQILVNGYMETEIGTNCARCLVEMKYPIKLDFSEVFAKHTENQDEYPFSGEIVELDKMMLDNVFLNLPVRFLCNPDCKGLCPTCGANLNVEKCTCSNNKVEEIKANPFTKLEGLFDENEEV